MSALEISSGTWGLNKCQERAEQCWMWSTLVLLRYISNHAHPMCQSVMALVVQCLFARRIWLCVCCSPLNTVCKPTFINIDSRNWALAGFIVRFPPHIFDLTSLDVSIRWYYCCLSWVRLPPIIVLMYMQTIYGRVLYSICGAFVTIPSP